MLSKVKIKRFENNEFTEYDDLIIEEHLVNIYLNRSFYCSIMCLPEYTDELTVGFLYSDGIIESYDDILNIDISSKDDVYIEVSESRIPVDPIRRTITSGFAGGSIRLSSLTSKNPPANTGKKISCSDIIKLSSSFNKRSDLFLKTGAVHSCQLILSNKTEIFREDIGRHNALDKIIGNVLVKKRDPKDSILITSGRISKEIVVKTAKTGIPVIVSTSAPTKAAVDTALQINLTLVGFSRNNRFNIYSGGFRITDN